MKHFILHNENYLLKGFFSVFLFLLFFFQAPCFAVEYPVGVISNTENNTSNNNLALTKLFSQAENISNQLGKIEKYIGKKPVENLAIEFSNVSLEEIYFCSRNLYKRTNRFNFEITGNYVKAPSLIEGRIITSDIEKILAQTEVRIQEVMNKFNMDIDTGPIAVDEKIKAVTKNDLLSIIRKANAQLSNMLYHKTMPSNVYSQVYLANQYLIKLINYMNVPLPIFKSKNSDYKRPNDVFNELIEVIAILNNFAESQNITMAKIIDANIVNQNHISPDDVLGLSELVLAKSKYMYMHCYGHENLPLVNYGYKVPMQVYEKSKLTYFLVETLLANQKKYCVESEE